MAKNSGHTKITVVERLTHVVFLFLACDKQYPSILLLFSCVTCNVCVSVCPPPLTSYLKFSSQCCILFLDGRQTQTGAPCSSLHTPASSSRGRPPAQQSLCSSVSLKLLALSQTKKPFGARILNYKRKNPRGFKQRALAALRAGALAVVQRSEPERRTGSVSC